MVDCSTLLSLLIDDLWPQPAGALFWKKNRVIKLDPFGECLQNAALKFRRSPSDLTCL